MTQTSMREHAVALASMGFRVFKLGVWGRIPVVENWPEVATSDIDQVRRMWTCPVNGEGLDNNIGVLTGAAGGDLMVLDVDRKNGAQGDKSLNYMIDSLELDTRTFTVRTPTGGSHLYLRTKEGEEVRNSVRQVGAGLDVRGRHGFVVGPGSETALGRYETVLEAPMAAAPDWLVNLAGRPRRWAPAKKGGKVEGLDLDEEIALERGAKYLVDDAPCAVEGFGGDATTFNVALRLGDLGVSESMALSLMLEQWNTDKALPSWPVEDLERKVSNAYQYRRRLLGVASPEVEFNDVSKEIKHPEPIVAKPAKGHEGKFRLIPFNEIVLPVDDEEYLVGGLVSRRAMALMWAGPGVGKSALALDLGLCVATGREWHGRAVEAGTVVYIAAEAIDDTIKRKAAWEKTFLIEGEALPPFYLIDYQVDLARDEKELGDCIAAILEQDDREANSLRLIVIDTMSKTLMRGSISDDEAVKPYLRAANALRRRFGCATLALHHCGWNDTRFMGSSLIMADLDIEIRLTRKEHDSQITMRVGKARSDALGKLQLHWRTEKVGLEPTRKGTPRDAFVVRPMSKAELEFKPVTLTEQETQLARFFIDFRNEDNVVAWVDIEPHALLEWKESKRTQARSRGDPSAAISKVRLRALRISLERKGIIEKIEQNQWLVKIYEL